MLAPGFSGRRPAGGSGAKAFLGFVVLLTQISSCRTEHIAAEAHREDRGFVQQETDTLHLQMEVRP